MRQCTLAIKTHLNGDITGAEVGVYAGQNSASLLDNIPNIVKLYLIDPYVLYCEWNPVDLPLSPEEAKKKAVENTAKHSKKVEFITSPFEKVTDIGPLDFVYIDGCHKYENVLQDCEKANTIVNKGIIGGHDYRFPSVKQAVADFCDKYGYTVNYGENEEDTFRDWWIIKGE